MTATVYEGCQMGSCFFIGHRETPDRVYPTLIETIAVSYTHLDVYKRQQLPRPTLGEQSRRTVQEHSK